LAYGLANNRETVAGWTLNSRAASAAVLLPLLSDFNLLLRCKLGTATANPAFLASCMNDGLRNSRTSSGSDTFDLKRVFRHGLDLALGSRHALRDREMAIPKTRLAHAPPNYRYALERQKPAGAVFRSRVQISTGGRNAGVAESRLHQVNGRTAVERVGSMSMPEPVRRYGQLDARAFGGCPDHAQNGDRLQERSVFPLARPEYGIVRLSGLRPKPRHEVPNRIGQVNRSGLASLPEHGNLAALSVWLQIPPAQTAQFAHPDSGRVEEREDRPVARIRFEAENPVQVGFGENALVKPVANPRKPQHTPDIERQISDAVPARMEFKRTVLACKRGR
jgi:hypothetical protein